jgi:hypothetical protein
MRALQSHPLALALALALASSVQPSCSAGARVVVHERALVGASVAGARIDAVEALRHLAAHPAERRGEGALVPRHAGREDWC